MLVAVVSTGIVCAQVTTAPTAASVAKEGETVVLSPFEVSGNPSDTYEATNTNFLGLDQKSSPSKPLPIPPLKIQFLGNQ